jgi:hypothetical protein
MFKGATRPSSVYKLVAMYYYIPIHLHISWTNGACKGLMKKASSFNILLFLYLTLDILGVSVYCDDVSGNQTKATERMKQSNKSYRSLIQTYLSILLEDIDKPALSVNSELYVVV